MLTFTTCILWMIPRTVSYWLDSLLLPRLLVRWDTQDLGASLLLETGKVQAAYLASSDKDSDWHNQFSYNINVVAGSQKLANS